MISTKRVAVMAAAVLRLLMRWQGPPRNMRPLFYDVDRNVKARNERLHRVSHKDIIYNDME